MPDKIIVAELRRGVRLQLPPGGLKGLKLARRVVQHEDALIGNPPPEPQRFDASAG
jgi:hypothetical protein